MTIFMLETYILDNEQNPDLGKQDKWPSFMNNKQDKNKKGEKEREGGKEIEERECRD